jgi:hypothetical protein
MAQRLNQSAATQRQICTGARRGTLKSQRKASKSDKKLQANLAYLARFPPFPAAEKDGRTQ